MFWDEVLHKAANISLDLTIERLGREDFQRQLEHFRRVQTEVGKACSRKVVFPCTSTGRRVPPRRTDCLNGDNGCGFECMDDYFENTFDESGASLTQ